MDHNPFRETNSHSASHEILRLLTCSQDPAIGSYPQPHESSPPTPSHPFQYYPPSLCQYNSVPFKHLRGMQFWETSYFSLQVVQMPQVNCVPALQRTDTNYGSAQGLGR
jgi:hypothetical protein